MQAKRCQTLIKVVHLKPNLTFFVHVYAFTEFISVCGLIRCTNRSVSPQQSKYKVMNKDQWYNVLEFSRTVNTDLSNYDEDGACKCDGFLSSPLIRCAGVNRLLTCLWFQGQWCWMSLWSGIKPESHYSARRHIRVFVVFRCPSDEGTRLEDCFSMSHITTQRLLPCYFKRKGHRAVTRQKGEYFSYVLNLLPVLYEFSVCL